MAKDTEETPETSPQTGDLDHRVDSLESKVDKILGLLSSDRGEQAEDLETPQQPGNIADEIRQQLDERDRKAKSEAEAQASTDRLGALEAKVSELAEQPPVTPPRKIERFMWGAR